MRKFFTIVVLSFCLAFIGHASSFANRNEIFVVTETWPPFRIVDKESKFGYTGIDLDLLKTLTQRLNITFKIKRYPWARCLAMMKNGQADIITGIAFTQERAQYIQYSKTPYHSVSPTFYLIKGKGHLIKRYDDLYLYEIGYSLKSAYFEPFDSDQRLKKHGVSKESQLIDMLNNNRLEVIIGSDSNIEYDIVKRGLKGKFEKAFYHPNKRTDLFIGISKKSTLIDRNDEIDEVLQKLIREGVIEAIVQNYL